MIKCVGHRGLKRRPADVAEVLLGCPHSRDQARCAAGPADLPAGAVEHLGGAGNRDGALRHARNGPDRQVAPAVERQPLVDLIGDHQKVMLHGHRRQRCQFVAGQHQPGRVMRGVDDDRPGPRGDRGAHSVHVEGETAAARHQWHRHPVRAGHRDHRGVGVEERLQNQHLRARLNQSEHRGRDGLAGPDGDQHLSIRVELLAVAPSALSGDGLTQFGDAQPRRILVDPVGDRLAGRLQHGRRPVLIGETLTEVHRTELSGQGRHLGEDVHREGLQTSDRHSQAA